MKRYIVKVKPKPHLHEPFDLGSYRWLWMARLRARHYLSDGLLRASTVRVSIVNRDDEVIEADYPLFGGKIERRSS